MIYDLFLVLPLIMLTVALALGAHQLLGFGSDPDGTVQLAPNLVRLVAGFTIMGFFIWFWLKNGQTLGMQAWRIELVPFEGGKLSLSRLALRCIGAFISAIFLGIGYLWCLVDRQNRYWHDYLSKTELRLLPKREKQTRDKKSATKQKAAATQGPD